MAGKRKVPDGIVVLDATYLVDVVRKRAEAGRFQRVLVRGEITSVNFGEAIYTLARSSTKKPEEIEKALVATGLTVVSVDLPVSRKFTALKAIDAKSSVAQERRGEAPPKTLSLGDLICLGYAEDRGRPVLTADRHWTTLGRYGLSVPVFDYRDPDTEL